jgi:ABC-2 type transport system ATP-binding protein
VIMTTTYLDEAERASDVVVLDDGRALLSGPPSEVIARAGTIVEVEHPSDAEQAWRRGRIFHQSSSAEGADVGVAIHPDLEDVVIAAMVRERTPRL